MRKVQKTNRQPKGEAFMAFDIGSTSIKLCTAQVQGRSITIERLVETPLPPNAVREGTLLEPDTVARALRETLQQVGRHPKTAVLAIAGPHTTARPVRLPPMPVEVLEKSIQFEAGRYLPSAAEEHFIGFEIVEQGEEHLEILLVAAPRASTEAFVELIEKHNIEVDMVELQPFAFWRAIQVAHRGQTPHAYAFVDIGGGHTQVSVVRGPLLALTRHIPIAGETLSAALKGYFHYSDEEAEQIKRNLNLAELIQHTPQENPPLRLVQPILDELIREIRRSLNYYQSQFQSQKGREGRIERLYLAGGVAQMQGIAAYFEHKMGIPTQVFDPFQSEMVAFGNFVPITETLGCQWVNALGATMIPIEQAERDAWYAATGSFEEVAA